MLGRIYYANSVLIDLLPIASSNAVKPHVISVFSYQWNGSSIKCNYYFILSWAQSSFVVFPVVRGGAPALAWS